MMYGTNERQIAASTLRAISKKKPMPNAGATPVPPAMPKKKRPMGADYGAAMDRGIRKAMRLPLE